MAPPRWLGGPEGARLCTRMNYSWLLDREDWITKTNWPPKTRQTWLDRGAETCAYLKHSLTVCFVFSYAKQLNIQVFSIPGSRYSSGFIQPSDSFTACGSFVRYRLSSQMQALQKLNPSGCRNFSRQRCPDWTDILLQMKNPQGRYAINHWYYSR